MLCANRLERPLDEYWDERDNHHRHDRTMTVIYYACTRRHRFWVRTAGTCWCGWEAANVEEDRFSDGPQPEVWDVPLIQAASDWII